MLLTGMNLTSYGLNLQKVCCKGIVAQFHWSLSTILQGIGRISRIGQSKPVEFRIVRQGASFAEYQEQRMLHKWVVNIRVIIKL